MSIETFVVGISAFLALTVYLFVSAPPKLTEGNKLQQTVEVTRLFNVLAKENERVRKLWTEEIVAPGIAAGLKFNEDWLDKGEEAGPLPALFLRETAKYLERDRAPVGLFLGSPFPIYAANRFQGEQARRFEEVSRTRRPQSFFAKDLKLYSAMYPDVAVTQGCIDCHNEHPKSPKKNWHLNDVMGATTWTYPKGKVTLAEVGEALSALRTGFRVTYQKYLDKSQTFKIKPIIGNEWPRAGLKIPSLEVFMQRIDNLNSADSYSQVLSLMTSTLKEKQKQNRKIAGSNDD